MSAKKGQLGTTHSSQRDFKLISASSHWQEWVNTLHARLRNSHLSLERNTQQVSHTMWSTGPGTLQQPSGVLTGYRTGPKGQDWAGLLFLAPPGLLLSAGHSQTELAPIERPCHSRDLKWPGQGPVVTTAHPKTSTGGFTPQGSTLNWTIGRASRASHAAVGSHKKLALPGHPKSPGGTNLCGSHQRSLSPVTPGSGKDSSGGECSVWQIRG